MRAFVSNRDYEKLSAYLDGQLSSSEHRKFEEDLQSRPELKDVLEDFRKTRTLLRAAPRKKAPRNFTLTPAMVGQIQSNRRKAIFPSLFPGFSFASALATIILITTLVLEVVPGSSINQSVDQQADTIAMQPSMEMAEESNSENRDGERLLMESPASEDSAAPAPEAESMEVPSEPAAEKSMPAGEGINPPIITWNDPAGMGGGGPESGRMLDESQPMGDYAPAPKVGMGGGGDDYPYGAQSNPGGPFVVPLEGVESIPESQPAAQADEYSVEEVPSSSFPSTGPFLGIAPSDQAGEIVSSSGWGMPLDNNAVESDSESPESAQRLIFGLPVLRVIQLLLALVAVITGAAAIFLRLRK